MAETKVHYNVRITIEKVEHIPTKTEPVGHPRQDVVVESKRVVTEAGKVELKHSNFETVKELAGKHLELLAEFDGTDARKGNTRESF